MISADDPVRKVCIRGDVSIHHPIPIRKGLKYSDVLKIHISVVKMTVLSYRFELRQIRRWLNGCNEPKRLYFPAANEIFESVDYYGNFISVERLNQPVKPGLKLVFENIAPYAFAKEETLSRTCTDSLDIQLENTSDEINEDYYPIVKIKSNANQTIRLINHSDNERTLTVYMNRDQILTFYNQDKYIEDNTGIFKMDDWNLTWFRLTPGMNDISILGNCIVDISCAYPRLAGGQ
ncbi:MAG: phage tail domain-containing protein [Frisingicoccus sp.]